MEKILLSLLISSAITSATGSELKKGDLEIGPLQISDIVPDCGCSFHFPRDKKEDGEMLIFWAFSENATMKINGKVIKLENIKEKIGQKLGDETLFSFQAEGISVFGNCKTTRVCPENITSCEVTEYTGDLVVTKGEDSIGVPVWGSCGC